MPTLINWQLAQENVSATTLYDYLPDVWIDESDTAHMVYIEENEGGDYELWYRFRNDVGQYSLRTIVPLEDPNEIFRQLFFAPKIAVDSNDDVHIVYVECFNESNAEDARIMYIRYDSSSSSWSDEVPLSIAVPRDENDYKTHTRLPDIFVDPDNDDIHVVWDQHPPESPGGNAHCVYWRVSEDGGDTFEDAIVISESCAARLDYPHAIEPGDKLSNRHGTKGTISRILPDKKMPHLPDGTPIELVCSFIGCHARLNFGQVREAILSRIARSEGKPFLAPAFQAFDDDEIKGRLNKAGLSESGMEVLTLDDKALKRPCTVGWVYWGKTRHLAKDKLHIFIHPDESCQLHGEMEYQILLVSLLFPALHR